jgi:hypothetical protein
MAAKPGLAVALAALLAGCGDTPAAEALRGMLPGSAAEAQIAAPAGRPALLLLAPRRAVLLPVSVNGSRRLWRAEGNIAIATDGPRVVGTAGLGQTLVSTRFEGPDPLADPRALVGREVTARRSVDLAGADREPGSMRFGLVLDCVLTGRTEPGWIVVEEHCGGGSLSFTNRFLADAATGIVRRSEQWVGEGVGMLSLEMRGV